MKIKKQFYAWGLVAAFVLILVAGAFLLSGKKENYIKNPSCCSSNQGRYGDVCLHNNECGNGLKCCFEKPGFDLIPLNGTCRDVCLKMRNPYVS